MASDVLAGIARDFAATRRYPASTYRLQFHHGLTFDDARELLPYLYRLGVGAIYASPYLKARPESTHGYDVSDHSSLNPAIGDEGSYQRMVTTLRHLGLGQILDIVPNHMGIGEPSNVWWMDVLENGPSSIYADYFDVDWHPAKEELRDRVLLPILGDQYGRVLENGELKIAYEGGAFFAWYYETKLPISPRSYNRILLPIVEQLSSARAEDDAGLMELESILTAVRNLPAHHERAPERRRERFREKEIIKRRLATLVETDPEMGGAIEHELEVVNGTVGEPRSFDRLDDLLTGQSYRLAFWRVASEEINYRRFFDINDLAAIRMENPEVFVEAHRLVLRLLGDGSVTGLRIDHPDGLWDPAGYFDRLQQAYIAEIARRRGAGSDEYEPALDPVLLEAIASARQDPANSALRQPLLVLIEKILGEGESLPESWPVSGTVGYEFTNALNGLFVDRSSARRFDQIYSRFIGRQIDYADLIYTSKQLISNLSLASEINTLAISLDRISERNRAFRDFTLFSLRQAIREVIACFPVYRTYISEDAVEPEPRDRGYIEAAVARARRRNPATDPTVFTFLRDILLLRFDEEADEETRAEQRRFVMKFQQTTGPIIAKGVEDTAFYIYNRLVSLNEVGGEPEHFGASVADFHRLNQERQRDWPCSLSSTSTHDTKRSEDVRARIDVLSEIPGEWSAALTRWSRRSRRKHGLVEGRSAPDANEDYLLYQTLLGVWPLDVQDGRPPRSLVERVIAYMAKATKEAKVNTSWINPNEAWDAAVAAFVEELLADDAFLDDFYPLQRRVAIHGAYNSLGQVLLKIASPGIPDIYQGQELWDFSLVDPDNRRPLDYSLRARLLRGLPDERAQSDVLTARFAADLLENWRDGRIKLWVTHRALTFRRDHPELMVRGDYRPLAASGARTDHVVAFARAFGDAAAIAIAPRLTTRLVDDSAQAPVGAEVWGDTRLSLDPVLAGRYIDVISGLEHDIAGEGAELPIGDVLSRFPVALLRRAR